MTHHIISPTTKGHRVWIQGLSGRWQGGTRYTVNYSDSVIHLVRDSVSGKRKVTSTTTKGGVIDLQSNKVTRWAKDSVQCTITVTDTLITIERV